MKRYLSLLITFSLVFSTCAYSASGIALAAGSSEMNIYAFYLVKNSGEGSSSDDEAEMGDAVLVESGGRYLLMDTGNSYVSDSVISYLNALNITHMDIYISHLHNDHFYGMEHIASQTNIIVDKLYLPDTSVGADYDTSAEGTAANQQERLSRARGYFPNAEVVYLKKGSQFSFGSVKATVLGPVSNNRQAAFKKDTYGQASGHYLNNQSLTTMLTCGSIKYLTTGDIESSSDQSNYKNLKLEEDALVATYGSSLKADILKMPHHGLLSSNSEAFIKAVKPTYAFAQNAGYESPVKTSAGVTTSRMKTTAERVQKTGLVYLVNNEKATLHINVKDNAVNLMKSSVSGGKVSDGKVFAGSSFTGWVDLYGHTQQKNGAYTGKDHYYMSKGKFKTGVVKINKKYYNFGSGVFLQQGVYKNGAYSGWNNIDGDKKKLGYFNKPDSAGRASAAIGFAVVKTPEGKKCGFYFDKKKLGARYVPSKGDSNSTGKKWKLKKVGSYKYLFKTKSGAVYNLGGTSSKYMKFKGGKLRAFDKKGRMLTGTKKVKGAKHKFDKKTGYRVK